MKQLSKQFSYKYLILFRKLAAKIITLIVTFRKSKILIATCNRDIYLFHHGRLIRHIKKSNIIFFLYLHMVVVKNIDAIQLKVVFVGIIKF